MVTNTTMPTNLYENDIGLLPSLYRHRLFDCIYTVYKRRTHPLTHTHARTHPVPQHQRHRLRETASGSEGTQESDNQRRARHRDGRERRERERTSVQCEGPRATM